MKLFITLEDSVAGSIANYLQTEKVNDPAYADISLIFFINPAGGVNDPTPYIKRSQTTGIIAGPPTEESIRFASIAESMGVLRNNILFTSTEGVSIEDIKALYDQLTASIPPTASAAPFISFSKAENPIVKVPKIIGFLSTKGGVGKSTYASCLAEHYNSVSEKVVLLDMCTPQNIRFHNSQQPIDCVAGNLDTLEELRPSYRRVIVDIPVRGADYKAFDALVLVIDADVIQCIEPAADFIMSIPMKPCAVIYNRKRAEVPLDIIKSLLPSIPIIPVADDFISCMAALSAGTPASTKSEIIADAVGKLAALIDGEGA